MTLVDTPGIGENEAMYTCAMNYIKRNRAAAYIYIIKTDNAGGVHDDRVSISGDETVLHPNPLFFMGSLYYTGIV